MKKLIKRLFNAQKEIMFSQTNHLMFLQILEDHDIQAIIKSITYYHDDKREIKKVSLLLYSEYNNENYFIKITARNWYTKVKIISKLNV